ncbi:MAG: peptidase S8, partial [Polyangiaceae bacterium]|nr:peptidase S8 [Polyangiaceae bacterium]
RARLAACATASAVALTSLLAAAGQEGSAPPPSPVDEASEDIPGAYVVDLVDTLDDGSVAGFFAELAVAFKKTALEPETRVELVEVRPEEVGALLARLGADARVTDIEPLSRYRVRFVPDDPMLDEQWHLTRVGAQRAWDFSTGRGVTVAVIDTGIACEDFGEFTRATDLASSRCVAGWNFVADSPHASDDHGHGTHVAGTIAQSTDNGIGAAGLGFDARLMPVKVLSAEGWGTTAAIADGIRWAAAHGAEVLNLSLGGPRKSRLLERAVAYARSRGAVVVAAAGNSGRAVEYPGGTEGVVGVAASDSNDALARFSSRGEGVDIGAPGVDVLQQTICNRGRDRCERFPAMSGTSMASPHVAAAAALLVSVGVTDPDAVEATLARTARTVESDGFGAGLLDASAALESVVFRQTLVRVLALVGALVLAFRWARKRDGTALLRSPRLWLAALLSGPGLLFLVPLVGSRHHDAVDMLARPIGDWDLLLDARSHAYLPLANVLLPLGLTFLLLRVRGAVAPIVGLCLGTAAYLVSVAVLGQVAAPYGRLATVGWSVANALGCLLLARLLLRDERGWRKHG